MYRFPLCLNQGQDLANSISQLKISISTLILSSNSKCEESRFRFLKLTLCQTKKEPGVKTRDILMPELKLDQLE
jgi:hypothetical protein